MLLLVANISGVAAAPDPEEIWNSLAKEIFSGRQLTDGTGLTKFEKEIPDRAQSRGFQAGGTGGAQPWDARDRVSQAEGPRAARRGSRTHAEGSANVRGTSPNFRASPLWTATGLPVVRRTPFTKVPFITPISSIT